MEREKFSSRIGFILISAGCAIGLGNVWRFPYITGKYGGAAFVLIYLFFLLVLGLPIMVMEFSVGRASQKSIATSFNVLEKEGTKWHIYRYFGIRRYLYCTRHIECTWFGVIRFIYQYFYQSYHHSGQLYGSIPKRHGRLFSFSGNYGNPHWNRR